MRETPDVSILMNINLPTVTNQRLAIRVDKNDFFFNTNIPNLQNSFGINKKL